MCLLLVVHGFPQNVSRGSGKTARICITDSQKFRNVHSDALYWSTSQKTSSYQRTRILDPPLQGKNVHRNHDHPSQFHFGHKLLTYPSHTHTFSYLKSQNTHSVLVLGSNKSLRSYYINQEDKEVHLAWFFKYGSS